MKRCSVCGTEYEGCGRCEKTHGWKFWVHKIEEYPIVVILNDYRGGVLDKKQAQEKFKENCGITADSDLSWMLPSVERDVRIIIGEKPVKPIKKSKLFKDE